MLKSTSDIWSGLGFLGISGAFYLQHEGEDGVSAMFPNVLMVLIALGGLYYLIRGLRERTQECPHGECPEGEHWGNIWWVSIMAIIYAAAIPFIGYWCSTGLFLAITYIGLVFRKNGLRKSLLIGIAFGGGFSFLVWVGFVKLMSVPTPEGVLW